MKTTLEIKVVEDGLPYVLGVRQLHDVEQPAKIALALALFGDFLSARRR